MSAGPDAPSALVGDLAGRYWNALSGGDRRGAVSLALEAVSAGASVEQTLAGLVCPAQVEVGRRWASNDWNVAQEHIATGISEEVVAALAASVSASGGQPSAGTAVVCCVEGEWHSLPARVLTETLRVNGWDVRYLGASLPALHLAQFVHDVGPDVVGLSCSVSTSLPHARRMIEAARGAGVPVIAGGRGFGGDGRWARSLGANGWAATATEAVSTLADPRWPRFADPVPPLDHPDDEAQRLRTGARDLAEAAVTRLVDRFPPMAQYDPAALERTREDLQHLVEFLSAALFVDDVSLFTEFLDWMHEILVARHVPAVALVAGLDTLSEVLAGGPRVGSFLASGRRVLEHRVERPA